MELFASSSFTPLPPTPHPHSPQPPTPTPPLFFQVFAYVKNVECQKTSS